MQHKNEISLNSPNNKNVKTNIGKILIKSIHKQIPKSNKLYKIFDRNTKGLF